MVALSPQTLAFFVVPVMQIHRAGGSCWFCGEMERFFFQTNQSSTPGGGEPSNLVSLYLANAPWFIQLPSPEVSVLLEKAAQSSHLEGEMKKRLREMLQ